MEYREAMDRILNDSKNTIISIIENMQNVPLSVKEECKYCNNGDVYYKQFAKGKLADNIEFSVVTNGTERSYNFVLNDRENNDNTVISIKAKIKYHTNGFWEGYIKSIYPVQIEMNYYLQGNDLTGGKDLARINAAAQKSYSTQNFKGIVMQG